LEVVRLGRRRPFVSDFGKRAGRQTVPRHPPGEAIQAPQNSCWLVAYRLA